MEITFVLNGTTRPIAVQPHETMLSVLRGLGMKSVRFGSDTGETGSSAVLVDGRLINTDILLAVQADGHEITTVEAFNAAELDPIQTAFMATGAIQSGYSVPAMILGTHALLAKNPDPTEAEVRDLLSGILDRETAYVKPVEAVMRAASILRG